MDCTGSTFSELQRRLFTCLNLQEFRPAALASQTPTSWQLAEDTDRKAWTKEARHRLRRSQKVRVHSNDTLILPNLFHLSLLLPLNVTARHMQPRHVVLNWLLLA